MKKIVVKLSSNLLNPDSGKDVLAKISEEISELVKKGNKVIIVTSGAVMHGMRAAGLKKRPPEMPMLQSMAAVGQIILMSRYREAFSKYGLICGQILLSADDFRIRNRYLNLRNTVESLLASGAIPVFNENDSVNTEELKFGDNDMLSAMIAIMSDFDSLIILTDVDGLFDKDPRTNKDAKLIDHIDDISDEYLGMTSGRTTEFSVGGMKKKIEASIKVSRSGISVFIGNGFDCSLLRIIEGREKGTYIEPGKKRPNARKKWLGFALTVKGSVTIDAGAAKALKNNSSLLAIGITGVKGKFDKGSLIDIVCEGAKIAQGLSNYSSDDIGLIKGKKSDELPACISNADYKEVIHKDNLYIQS